MCYLEHVLRRSLGHLSVELNYKNKLRNEVQRSIKAALPVHVLPVLPFQNDMNRAHVVSFHLFAFGSVKIAESHHSHHLLRCFALKIRLCNEKNKFEENTRAYFHKCTMYFCILDNRVMYF